MSVYGPLLGPWNVEQALLGTLELWLPEYLAELERQNGLLKRALGRPPTPESYHGGLDLLSIQQARCPEVIAICNPTGEPERMVSTYMQAFQAEVGCVLFSEEGSDPEGVARRNAGFFASAVMATIVQQAGRNLASLEEVVLTGVPRVEFHDAENRRIAVGLSTFHVYASVIEPAAGPNGATPETAPGYQGREEAFKEPVEVTKETITATAVEISKPV